MIEFKFGDKYVDTKIISVRQSELIFGYMIFKYMIFEHFRKISNEAELNEFKQHIKTVDELIFDGKLREVLGGDEN